MRNDPKRLTPVDIDWQPFAGAEVVRVPWPVIRALHGVRKVFPDAVGERIRLPDGTEFPIINGRWR